jgi:hypothetical protein
VKRSRSPLRRRASGLFLALLLATGALPVHGEHLEHASAPAGAVVSDDDTALDAARTHPPGPLGHQGHHDHHGHDDHPAPEDADSPCPRGPCPAGAPACAVTLGPAVLPSLAPGPVLSTPKARIGELHPPSVTAESLFRPPRGGFVTAQLNPAR